MAYGEAPHKVFPGLGEPDSTRVNPETGDSSYYYSGELPKGIQSGLGLLGTISNLLGWTPPEETGGGVSTKFPDNSRNPLNQEVLNVSSMNNENNSTQMRTMEDESLMPPDSLVNEINTQNNMFNDLPNEHGLTDNMQKTFDWEGGNVGEVYVDTSGVPHYGVGHKLTQEESEGLGLRGDVSYAGPMEMGGEGSFESYPTDSQFSDLTSEIPSDAERMDLFKQDYAEASKGAGRLLGQYGGDMQDMPPDLRGVFTDMVLNMGTTKIGTKYPKFLKAIRDADWKQAAAQLRYVNPRQNAKGEWISGGPTKESKTGESLYYQQTGRRAKSHYNTLLNYQE